MATIEIKNIGPIKDTGQIELNSLNVFMGVQSSGKSTIAKIISHCLWVEKEVATLQSVEAYRDNRQLFKIQLEQFHHLLGYFYPDSYVCYVSETVKIIWEKQKCEIALAEQHLHYQRSKIAYIPSERNMVVLSAVRKVEFGNTNIRSFLFDWFEARKYYSERQRLDLLNLKVAYYYTANSNDEDRIGGVGEDGRNYELSLSNASSGLQALTPLLVMTKYLSEQVYKEEFTSYEQSEREKQLTQKLLSDIIEARNSNETTKNDAWKTFLEIMSVYEKKFKPLLTHLFQTQNSQYIIEEPELNLFPATQRDLIYYLVKEALIDEEEHKGTEQRVKAHNRLTITTHSPYVLYTLNNCMLAGGVYDRMSKDEQMRLGCAKARIAPERVSIYEIHDGRLRSIQKEDGLIVDNYFDQMMKELMDEYYLMLNYYE